MFSMSHLIYAMLLYLAPTLTEKHTNTLCCMYSVLDVLCVRCTRCCMYSVLHVLCVACTLCCMYSVLHVLCVACTLCYMNSVLRVLCVALLILCVRYSAALPNPPAHLQLTRDWNCHWLWQCSSVESTIGDTILYWIRSLLICFVLCYTVFKMFLHWQIYRSEVCWW